MTNLIADRLREVSLNPQGLPIDALGDQAQALSESIDLAEVPELLRAAFSKQITAEFNSHFRESFRQADEAFPQRGGNQYVAVMAAETAIRLVEANSDVSAWAALGIVAAQFRGWKPAHDDLTAAGDAARVRLAKLRREARLTTVPNRKGLDFDPNAISTVQELGAIVQSLDAEITKSRTMLRDASRDSVAALASSLTEKVEILWWLMAGKSWVLDRPYSDLDPTAASLAAAIEMADQTKVIPGPVSADGILAQAVGLSSPSSKFDMSALRRALKANDKLKELVPEAPSEIADFTPLLESLRKGAAVGKAQRSAFEWSHETYVECLLARAWNESNEIE